MRKFIVFLLFLVGINMNAMADGNNTSCFTKADPDAVDFTYTVLFEHDKDIILDATCKRELEQELKSIQVDKCKLILLIGSTDTTGNAQYNTGLGQRRINYVRNLFNESQHSKIVVHNGGESNAYYYTGDNTHYPNERAVHILIADKKTCSIEDKPEGDSTPQQPDDSDVVAMLQQVQVITARKYIDAAMSGIKDIEGKDMKVSKWKDAEGNFNTARLASDSIAGVVLGTAGGLITSSVVKKSQIKKGFEDIGCTIGGQTVAGWGDQFTVGIK